MPVLLMCQSKEILEKRMNRLKWETPERFEENPAVGSQKDTDARWTKRTMRFTLGIRTVVDNAHVDSD